MDTLRGIESGRLKQLGVIVFDVGLHFDGRLNAVNAISEAKAKGWRVVLGDGCAMLFR